jgi:uncharacterized protein with GYD domain
MAIYITQGRFTEQAMKGMTAKPEDRAKEVAKLYEANGAKLVAYYVTFGEYDFMTIGEGPSDDLGKVMGALVTAAIGGGVTDLKTTLGMTSAEAVKVFETAGRAVASFRSAGAG